MKHIKQLSVVFSFLIISSLSTTAQTFDWASAYQGGDNIYGQDVETNSSDEVVSVGYFYGTADFDPSASTENLTAPNIAPNNNQDIYVTKLDVSGNLIWAQQFGDTERDRANNVYVDKNDDIYVTGYFEGTVDFNPGSGTAILTSQNVVTAFVLKLDTDGNFLWVRKFGGTGGVSEGLEITADSNGDVIIGGYFTADCDFNPAGGGLVYNSSVARDGYIVKLTSTGDFVWARHLVGDDDNRVNSIAVDANDNIYAGGFFSGQLDFDQFNPGTSLQTTNSGPDMFVARYDSGGMNDWSTSITGTGSNQLKRLSVNNNGDIFVTGQFQNTLDFDPGTGTASETASNNESFVWSLNSTGAFNWVQRIGGSGQDVGYGIANGPDGSVYATGYFNNTADFGGGTTMTALGGSHTIYVVKYLDDGTLEWTQRMGGSNDDFGINLYVDDSWDVISTGFFLQDSDFDPDGGGAIITATNLRDAYVHKLSQTCTAPALDSINYVATDTLFCPGAMASTQLVAIGDLNDASDWEWYTGGCGMTHVASGDTVNLMPTETTTYYVRAEGACGTAQTCDSITIYIDDFEAPVADVETLGDITEICEVTNLTTPTATDNCDGSISGTHDAILPITSNTTITWTYTDNAGNETTQTQDVVMTGVDVSTTVDGITLIANNSNVGVSYRWLDCNDGNSPIVNATNQTYTPDENGSYAVIVLQEGCQDTSDCIDITTVGLEDFAKTNINVYPNPSAGEFNVELASADAVNYTVTDNAGRIVLEGTFEQLENTIDLSSEEQGVYFLRVDGSVMKLVVQ